MPELVAPIMPDIAGSFQPLARGMAQWAQNRRYAQQLELNYQKQAQDAALEQEKFGLTRQQLAQQYELQRHQMDATDAEANLRNAQAGYYTNVKAKDAQDKSNALGAVADLAAQVDQIPNEQWGTTDGHNALAQQMNDANNTGALDTPAGLRVRANAWSRQRLAASRRAQDFTILKNGYYEDLKTRGIPPSAVDMLQKDDKGNFVPNNNWARNDDGSVFLTLAPVPDAQGKVVGTRVVDPSEFSGPDPTKNKNPTALGWASITLKPKEANDIISSRNKMINYRSKIPISDLADAEATNIGVQNAAAQQRAQAAGVATPANPQPGDVYKGYRFIGGDPSNQASWQQVQ